QEIHGTILQAALMVVASGIAIHASTKVGRPQERWEGERKRARRRAANIRGWAPTLFAWLGYDPYADLTEKSLSARPPSGSAEGDQIQGVDGARLNGVKLRYAQAYGVFLANAH